MIALGIEYKPWDRLFLRCGYNYANNPVPENTVIPIFPAVVTNHFTAGIGVQLNENLRLDAAYEFVPIVELEVSNHRVANEYVGSTSSLGENTIHFSFSRSL